MNTNKENRPIFDSLDQQLESQQRFDSRLGWAADQAMQDVDQETIRLYRRYGIELPARLAKIAWREEA